MNYRLRNLKCIFQHWNIVTAVDGYETMLWLALRCFPELQILELVMNQWIVEMFDVLISNAAYTGREEQRTGSAVSKSLHPSSAPFQVHSRNLHRTESHEKVYETLAQKKSFQWPLLWLTSCIPSSTCRSASNEMAPWHCYKVPVWLGKQLHLQLEIPSLNSTNLRPFVITTSILKVFPSVRYFSSQVPVKSFESNSVIESLNYFLSSSPSVMFM